MLARFETQRRVDIFCSGVPMFRASQTKQVATLGNDGKPVFLFEPEHHDSRMVRVNAAPVFWHFATGDLAALVLAVEFRKASVMGVTLCSWQGEPSDVVYAVK